MILTIIYFILILGITVFIHELGHFLFAKKFGVYVYEFSIGMGPKLFKFNRKNDETNYCIRLFPIGGFVQMYGEEAIDTSSCENNEIPKDRSLQAKPAFQRFMIMIAGVMMNFLLAIVLLFVIGLFKNVSLDTVYVQNSTIPGLNDNDKIIAVDGNKVNNYDKLALEMTIKKDTPFNITVLSSDGKKKDIKINPVAIGESNLLYGKDYGFSLKRVENTSSGLINVLKITNSKLENVQNDSDIIAVNGIEINDYLDLINALDSADESAIKLTLSYNNEVKDVTISVKENSNDDLLGYNYGFYIAGHSDKGLIQGIKYAFFKFFSTIEQMIFTVLYLITGKLSLSMLSGPVGIFNVVSTYSSYGFANIVSLLCLICINVGFINILPLPAFDGGHVLFIIIEKIKGSKVNPKVENTIHNIGFILLMILMVLVTYNDIIRLF